MWPEMRDGDALFGKDKEVARCGLGEYGEDCSMRQLVLPDSRVIDKTTCW